MKPKRCEWRRSMRWLPVAGMICVSLPTFADSTDTFGVFAGKTLVRDDNVFRTAQNIDADTIDLTYAGITFDTQLSLQRLHLEASTTDNRYEKLNFLDNTGSRYVAGWQGILPGHLKMDANWSRVESLAGFADFRANVKNILTTESANARLQYSLTPDITLFGLAARGESTNSAASNAASDARTRTTELGSIYATPLRNRVGLTLRSIDGYYPNRLLLVGTTIDNSYEQQDLEGNLTWMPSNLSQLDLRCARTEREYNDVPQRNFNGVTGSVKWGWTPSAMSGLDVYLRRELGATDYLQANYSVTRTIGIAPRWTPSPKLILQAQVERRERTFAGDPQFDLSGTPVLGDTLNSWSISVQYLATDWAQFSLSARREDRDSDNPALPYVANVISLGAQLMF